MDQKMLEVYSQLNKKTRKDFEYYGYPGYFLNKIISIDNHSHNHTSRRRHLNRVANHVLKNHKKEMKTAYTNNESKKIPTSKVNNTENFKLIKLDDIQKKNTWSKIIHNLNKEGKNLNDLDIEKGESISKYLY